MCRQGKLFRRRNQFGMIEFILVNVLFYTLLWQIFHLFSYRLIFIIDQPFCCYNTWFPLVGRRLRKPTKLLPHPHCSPVLEEAQALVGPDADEALDGEGLQGPQRLEDAPHPASHLSGGVDVVGLGVLGEALLQQDVKTR